MSGKFTSCASRSRRPGHGYPASCICRATLLANHGWRLCCRPRDVRAQGTRLPPEPSSAAATATPSLRLRLCGKRLRLLARTKRKPSLRTSARPHLFRGPDQWMIWTEIIQDGLTRRRSASSSAARRWVSLLRFGSAFIIAIPRRFSCAIQFDG